MTSLIQEAFNAAGRENRSAFIPYMTAGFPDPVTCLEVLQALDQNGADVIEIGLPFSDPIADGKVIQQSSGLALNHGMTPEKVLALAARAKSDVKSPIVIMTYWNPIFRMGLNEFAVRAHNAGVSGVIVPDLPPEEAGEWLEAAEFYNLDTVFMVAPTTTPGRRDLILAKSRGFLYYVSLTGVTGSDFSVSQALTDDIRNIRARSPIPVAVGFGVRGPEQAGALAAVADGVIVGTALIRSIMDHEEPADQVDAVARLAASLSVALRRNGQGRKLAEKEGL